LHSNKEPLEWLKGSTSYLVSSSSLERVRELPIVVHPVGVEFRVFRGMINDNSSPKFDRKQEIKHSKDDTKNEVSYPDVSPKE